MPAHGPVVSTYMSNMETISSSHLISGSSGGQRSEGQIFKSASIWMKFGRNDPWVTGTDIGGQFGSRSKFKVKGQIFKSASIWMKFGRNDPWVTGTDIGGQFG